MILKELLESNNLKFDDKFDAVILGVAHQEFENLNLSRLTKTLSVIYDVKGFMKTPVDGRL